MVDVHFSIHQRGVCQSTESDYSKGHFVSNGESGKLLGILKAKTPSESAEEAETSAFDCALLIIEESSNSPQLTARASARILFQPNLFRQNTVCLSILASFSARSNDTLLEIVHIITL